MFYKETMNGKRLIITPANKQSNYAA